MSSVNRHFTFRYAQPAEYRFSHDSVFLARRAFEELAPRLREGFRLLDLAAGCGIVGLDFLWHLKHELEASAADFVDIQPEYRDAFAENAGRAGLTRARTRFVRANWTDHAAEPYDVVLCNPPYFAEGRGKLPADPFRARCHFLRDASWPSLVACVMRNLAPGGDALVLCREPDRFAFSGARLAGDVRGTPLYHRRFDHGTVSSSAAQN